MNYTFAMLKPELVAHRHMCAMIMDRVQKWFTVNIE